MSEHTTADDGSEVEQSGPGYGYVTVAESRVNDTRNDIPAGKQTLHAGKDVDPDYEVLVENGTQEITHKIVRTIELPERMPKAKAIKYVQQNHSRDKNDDNG